MADNNNNNPDQHRLAALQRLFPEASPDDLAALQRLVPADLLARVTNPAAANAAPAVVPPAANAAPAVVPPAANASTAPTEAVNVPLRNVYVATATSPGDDVSATSSLTGSAGVPRASADGRTIANFPFTGTAGATAASTHLPFDMGANADVSLSSSMGATAGVAVPPDPHADVSLAVLGPPADVAPPVARAELLDGDSSAGGLLLAVSAMAVPADTDSIEE